MITERGRLRKGLRFMVHPRPGTSYDMVSEELVDDHSGRPHPGQTILRLHACSGYHREVAHRIVTLLNTYGLVPGDLDIGITCGTYEVRCMSPDPEEQEEEGWQHAGDYENYGEAMDLVNRLRETGQLAQVRIVATLSGDT